MPGLKLSKLPDRTPVKLTVSLSPDLYRRLQDYAAAYAETYQSQETVTDLVPAMLTAFVESDREFARRR